MIGRLAGVCSIKPFLSICLSEFSATSLTEGNDKIEVVDNLVSVPGNVAHHISITEVETEEVNGADQVSNPRAGTSQEFYH